MSTLCLKNGHVFDPINKVFNKKKDIYVKDGKITEKLSEKIAETIDCRNKIKIPNDSEIEKDISKWVSMEEKLENPDQMIDFQTEYTKELHEMSDYPKIDFELIRKHFKDWEHHKMDDISTYRNKSFSSPVTGSIAPIHHTPWASAMDDSMDTFLK